MPVTPLISPVTWLRKPPLEAEHRDQAHGFAQLGDRHPVGASADPAGQHGCPIEQQHRPVLRARARPGRRGEVGRLQERRALVQHGHEARLELRLSDIERVADDDGGEVAPTGAVAVDVRPISGTDRVVVDQALAGAGREQPVRRRRARRCAFDDLIGPLDWPSIKIGSPRSCGQQLSTRLEAKSPLRGEGRCPNDGAQIGSSGHRP